MCAEFRVTPVVVKASDCSALLWRLWCFGSFLTLVSPLSRSSHDYDIHWQEARTTPRRPRRTGRSPPHQKNNLFWVPSTLNTQHSRFTPHVNRGAYRVSHHRSLGYGERRCGFHAKPQSTNHASLSRCRAKREQPIKGFKDFQQLERFGGL